MKLKQFYLMVLLMTGLCCTSAMAQNTGAVTSPQPRVSAALTTPLLNYEFTSVSTTAVTGFFTDINGCQDGPLYTATITSAAGFPFIAGQTTSTGWGLTAASATITNTSTSGLSNGELVTGMNVPYNSTILSIVSNTSITISNAVTGTNTQSLMFGQGIPSGATGFIGTVATAALYYGLGGPSYAPASGYPQIPTGNNVTFGTATPYAATHY